MDSPYPAIRFLAGTLRVFAVICLLGASLSAFAAVAIGTEGADAKAVVAALAALVGCALLAAGLFAGAALLRLLMDMEASNRAILQHLQTQPEKPPVPEPAAAWD